MGLIAHALKMAKLYYDENNFYHAIRVACYIVENPLIPDEIMNNCIALAIMHDLCEDTKYPREDTLLNSHFVNCLDLITKEKDEDYIKYIDIIKKYAEKFPEAYWVKIADMKDHLSQTDTLTDKLKEKYLKGLAHLL